MFSFFMSIWFCFKLVMRKFAILTSVCSYKLDVLFLFFCCLRCNSKWKFTHGHVDVTDGVIGIHRDNVRRSQSELPVGLAVPPTVKVAFVVILFALDNYISFCTNSNDRAKLELHSRILSAISSLRLRVSVNLLQHHSMFHFRKLDLGSQTNRLRTQTSTHRDEVVPSSPRKILEIQNIREFKLEAK